MISSTKAKGEIFEGPAAFFISPVHGRQPRIDVSTNILLSMPSRRFWRRVFRHFSIGRELIRINRLRRTVVPCPSRRNRRRAAIFRAVIRRRRLLIEAPHDNGHDTNEEQWYASDEDSGETEHEDLIHEDTGIELDEEEYLHSLDYGDTDDEDCDDPCLRENLESEDDGYFSDHNSDSNSDTSSDETDIDFETMCQLYGTPPSPLFIPFMGPVIPLREHLSAQGQSADFPPLLDNEGLSSESDNVLTDIDVDHDTV
ncbi:hypothetical protein VNI00_017005 [Paramarasmius palmivorus]|uniref:Uncharacterized protein n=1 Tax=Paramarasmius palmivorus TaxID=297713 RepID=A0AAW0BAQ3_9AGAR